MPVDCQSRNFGTCSECAVKVLKFRGKLAALRDMKGLKVRDLANLCGIDRDRFEDIYEGTHAPNPADVIRIMNGLQIVFKPEDFEEYGL